MKTNNNINKPYANMNCIWAASELVKYKLCDKQFDCENCEFDKVIRNLSARGNEQAHEQPDTGVIERLIKRIENVSYDNKLIYLKNQLVMKNLFGNAYYLGINPILLYLLDDISTIDEIEKSDIKKGQAILTFNGSWGTKEFISPANFMLIEKINILESKFSQWYAIILFNPPLDEPYTIGRDEWAEQKENVIEQLHGYINNAVNIGPSMLDGGEKVSHLHQYLGKDSYINLLNSIFQ